MSICTVSPSYSYSYHSSYDTCWMLVHAYATLPRKGKWSGPHHIIKMLHFVLFHGVICYTNSIVSCIHVNTPKICIITCTLVATGVILQSSECRWLWGSYENLFKAPVDSVKVVQRAQKSKAMTFCSLKMFAVETCKILIIGICEEHTSRQHGYNCSRNSTPQK